jgi:proteasome accessory factor B
MSGGRTERLLNLVFCLMAARRAVSRSAIQSSVPGYAGDQGDAAFERMFERDKDELRQMGIPVETVVDTNGEVEGYRIKAESYRLEPIAFTPDELRVIALAAQVWDEAILGPAAMTALRKIEAAQQAAPVTPGDLRVSVQLAAADQALMPLLQAVRERRSVTFAYRGAADDAPSSRRLDPWGVVSREGRWYVIGHDHDRKAPRSFRLSRIEGPVQVRAAAQTVHRDPQLDLAALLVPGDPEAPASARVRVRAGEAAQLRRLAHAGVGPFDDGIIEVSAPTRMQLVAAILGAGASARVEEPAEVREAVLAGLRSVADMHAGTP